MLSKVAILLTCIFYTGILSSSAQGVITLQNPSFEDIPRKGADHTLPIKGWHDCGLALFVGESPPDIHPVPTNAWEVNKDAYDGSTFLGLVTRANDSYESLSQALSSPIQANTCYQFTAFLARSEQYKSATSRSNQALENFVRPVVLQVWGGNSFCDKKELLGESPPVSNAEWKMFKFTLQPRMTHKYIIIAAFYKTPILEAYNGHVLVDKLSELTPIACPMFPEDLIAEVSDPPSKTLAPTTSGTTSSSTYKGSKSGSSGTINSGTITSGPKTFKPELLIELDPKKMYVGQKIRLTHLYFKADSVNLLPDSYKVLNELAEYLKAYPKTTIEIGGHTNTIPPEDYCIALSTSRARSVQEYLVKQGIPEIRLQYKGYGKSEPLITYDRYNKEARLKNQRVEIKILSLS